jgi:hypothetical protein
VHPDLRPNFDLSQLQMDINSFIQGRLLGVGSFGMFELMIDGRSDRYVVKFSSCTMGTCATFVRDFVALFRLNHPYAVPC